MLISTLQIMIICHCGVSNISMKVLLLAKNTMILLSLSFPYILDTRHILPLAFWNVLKWCTWRVPNLPILHLFACLKFVEACKLQIEIHVVIAREGILEIDLVVGTAFVDMYGKWWLSSQTLWENATWGCPKCNYLYLKRLDYWIFFYIASSHFNFNTDGWYFSGGKRSNILMCRISS